MNGAGEVSMSNENWSRELKILAGFAAAFVALFFLPVGVPRFDNAIKEGLELTRWYAQEHVLLCLVPALFIAGGISAFVSQASVMRSERRSSWTTSRRAPRSPTTCARRSSTRPDGCSGCSVATTGSPTSSSPRCARPRPPRRRSPRPRVRSPASPAAARA